MNYAETTVNANYNQNSDSISIHGTFIKKEKEEPSEKIVGDTYVTDLCIKKEKIEIKQEKPNEEEIPIMIPYQQIKKEEDVEGDPSLHFLVGLNGIIYTETRTSSSLDDTLEKNNLNTKYQDYPESHESKPHNTSEMRTFEWHNTDCQRKGELEYTDTSESKTYKCDDYQLKTESSYTPKLHRPKGSDSSKTTPYRCDKCHYKTHNKGNLSKHQVTHTNPWEARIYKCEKCPYETKRKSNLKTHELCHKDASEVPMYGCDLCSCVFKAKAYLVRHQMTHKDPSELRMYKCDECAYQSKHKANLKAHKLLHRDASEVQLYRCDMCSFATKNKGYLAKHVSNTHKCNECEFETEYRLVLKRHQLVHKIPPQHEDLPG